jgi:uncharacterized protein (TIGR00290 family)
MTSAWMSWSSGKDSAYALHRIREAGEFDVTGLLVTMNANRDRVAMHDVRRELLQAQADALGLPLHVVPLPWPCPNDVYEARMTTALGIATAQGVTAVVFGDLFLADIRAYREDRLRGTGVEPVFPLWQQPTDTLAKDMVASGVRAVLTCIDNSRLPASFAGRWFDQDLLDDLPEGVDPCGENGEFHTFVCDAPGFSGPISVQVRDITEREGFSYADVVPA